MPETAYWFAASTEEFTPTEILEQSRAAEAAGFDALGISDHFTPWFSDGLGTQAWVTLGAVGQATTKPLGTGVTPVIHHYHPGVIAQAFMSLEELYPGRVFLGVGSGEALNEIPLGLDWPEPGEMLERFDRGLEAIDRLWSGETVTMDGGWFEVIYQAGFAWAGDEEQALAGARRWKPTQMQEVYREDISDPAEMQRRADDQLSDQEFAKQGFIVGSDPDEHVERIRQIEQAGATAVCLQLIGNADPMGSIRTYGERVLPALRGG